MVFDKFWNENWEISNVEKQGYKITDAAQTQGFSINSGIKMKKLGILMNK